MARIKSTWYKSPSLRYGPPIKEVRRQEQEYRDWLASTRGWNEKQVDEHIVRQRDLTLGHEK